MSETVEDLSSNTGTTALGQTIELAQTIGSGVFGWQGARYVRDNVLVNSLDDLAPELHDKRSYIITQSLKITDGAYYSVWPIVFNDGKILTRGRHNKNGYYVSNDAGNTWSIRSFGSSSGINFGESSYHPIAKNNSTETVITNQPISGKLLRTTNKGETWQSITVSGASNLYFVFCVKGVFFCSGVSGTVYRSTNDGVSFSPVNGMPIFVSLIEIKNGHLIGLTKGGEIHRSTDNGINWAKISDTHNYSSYNGHLTEFNDGTLFCADVNAAVFKKSTDNSVTWSDYTAIKQLPIRQVEGVYADSNEILINGFDGTEYVYYRSTDGGKSFVEQTVFNVGCRVLQKVNDSRFIGSNAYSVRMRFDFGFSASQQLGSKSRATLIKTGV